MQGEKQTEQDKPEGTEAEKGHEHLGKPVAGLTAPVAQGTGAWVKGIRAIGITRQAEQQEKGYTDTNHGQDLLAQGRTLFDFPVFRHSHPNLGV